MGKMGIGITQSIAPSLRRDCCGDSKVRFGNSGNDKNLDTITKQIALNELQNILLKKEAQLLIKNGNCPPCDCGENLDCNC